MCSVFNILLGKGVSSRTLTIANDLLDVLKLWKQTTQFSSNEDWIFASPAQIGRLPWSYTGVKEELQRAADAAGIGQLRSHTFRHTTARGSTLWGLR